jgi:hypothetical protein
MQAPESFRRVATAGFDVHFESHAAAILEIDFPGALAELADVLLSVEIPIEELIGSGGGETKGTQRLRRALTARNWNKRKFKIEKIVDGIPRESISHEVDHVRVITSAEGKVTALALEIEWNNKDPFFDRDLENFKRLHSEGAISAGIIVTRGISMQEKVGSFVQRWAEENEIKSFEDLNAKSVFPTRRQRDEVQKRVDRARNPGAFAQAWTNQFVSDKFGAATTHWSKLMERIRRGVGSPCPLLLVGIPAATVTFNEDPAVVQSLIAEGREEDSE